MNSQNAASWASHANPVGGIDFVVSTLNDLFLLEKRLSKLDDSKSYMRYVERIKDRFAELGVWCENPIGERFVETRTDCDASIAGESTDNLVIQEVVRPIIRAREGEHTFLVQRARVIVGSEPL